MSDRQADLLWVGFCDAGDDVVGDSVNVWVDVADPGDELGQGSQPGVGWQALREMRHGIGHSYANLAILQGESAKHREDSCPSVVVKQINAK